MISGQERSLHAHRGRFRPFPAVRTPISSCKPVRHCDLDQPGACGYKRSTVDRMMAKKAKRVSRQPLYLSLLGEHVTQLRQVEERLDGLFRQVINELSEESLAQASEQFEELVLSYPELRLAHLRAYPRHVHTLLARLDLRAGPLDGFDSAMNALYDLCVTPEVLGTLRAKLYRIAAETADRSPDLLPTVAIASLSIKERTPTPNALMQMVICASAIECYICANLPNDGPPSTDVSLWLAAEPSDALLAAVGEGPAHYFAPIPGILPFLDQDRVLFHLDQLAPASLDGDGRYMTASAQSLDTLVDREYRTLLSEELRRVRHVVRQRYPDIAAADLEMLSERALDALDALPPHVNPLIQAIFVQSWVRCLHELS
jgi:hypothetical protein